MMGFYGCLDFGIRFAVPYFTALYHTKQETGELNSSASTAIWTSSLMGVLTSVAAWFLAPVFSSAFHISGADAVEAQIAIGIMGIATGISLPIEVLNSFMSGAMRLDRVNHIDVLFRMSASAGMLIYLQFGSSLLALACIQLFCRAVSALWIYRGVRQALPELSLLPTHCRLRHLRELVGYGVPSLLINVGWLLGGRTDLALIGMYAGVGLVPAYAIPRSLMEYANTGVRAITGSYITHLTNLHASGDVQGMLGLFAKGARLSNTVVAVLCAGILVFGRSFLGMWQGRDFVTGPWWNQGATALFILVIAFLPRLAQNMSSQLLSSTYHLGAMVWISILEGVSRAALGWVGVQHWGLAGVGMANLIVTFFFQGVVLGIYVFRRFEISFSDYFREVLSGPVLVGMGGGLAGAMLVAARRPENWATLIGEASVMLSVSLVIAFRFALTPAERAAARLYVRQAVVTSTFEG